VSVQTETVELAEAIEVMPPAHDEIAERAYEIHLSGEGGDELENWLQAERELMAAHGDTAADSDDA
jgi:hypothetical protein